MSADPLDHTTGPVPYVTTTTATVYPSPDIHTTGYVNAYSGSSLWDSVDRRIQELESRIKRLESALGDYLLFEEPKVKGPARAFWDEDAQ